MIPRAMIVLGVLADDHRQERGSVIDAARVVGSGSER